MSPGTRRPYHRDASPSGLTDANVAGALRELLAEARSQRLGFDRAWTGAVAGLDWDALGGLERDSWEIALTQTRHHWERAYARESTREVERVARLAA